MISSTPRFELSCSQWKTREGPEEREQPLDFHVNEPFYHDGSYKTNKVIKFFSKKEKRKQVSEFIRVKTFIILNLRNEKVTSIVFHVKSVNKSTS